LAFPGASHGTCVAKTTTPPTVGSLKVYLGGIIGWSGSSPSATNIQTRGIKESEPFSSIHDALAKAYELGATYVSADVTIIMNDKTHIWRPYKKNEFRYKPLYADD
jgi:hypothetical protein